MKRLTDEIKFPLDTFKRCQLCGHTGDKYVRGGDICEFRMHRECDEDDRPEDKYIVICAKGKCAKKLINHPRLYIEVPWGQGKPGIFMLTCSDCQFRNGTDCKHPDLKANGGSGLEAKIGGFPQMNIHISFSNGKGGWLKNNNPITQCMGKK